MRSIPILTCIAATILALALGWISYVAFESAETDVRRDKLQAIGRQFNSSMAAAGRMVMAQADIIGGLPGMRSAMAEVKHDEILSRLLPSFDTLKNQFSLDLLQAIGPDNVVLARAHDPTHFGDDLSTTRPMVVQANVSGQPQSGLEVGPAGLRVRAVVPVINQGKKVGVFEVGQSIDQLLENVRRGTNADVALLLNINAVGNLASAFNSEHHQRFGELIGDVSTNWSLLAEAAKTIGFAQVKDPVVSSFRTESHAYSMMQMAFVTYGGQPMGNFVVIEEVDGNARYRRTVLLEIMSVALIGAILISCLILVTFRGLLLGPVIVAAAQAEKLAGGETPPPLPKRTGDDSVSRLFAALERIRANKKRETSGGSPP